jgi:hypothetical protein
MPLLGSLVWVMAWATSVSRFDMADLTNYFLAVDQ